MFWFVFIYYCYVTDCHMLIGLTQHKFTVSQSLWVRNPAWFHWVLCSRLKWKCWLGLIWNWRSSSMLIQVIDRIQLITVVGCLGTCFFKDSRRILSAVFSDNCSLAKASSILFIFTSSTHAQGNGIMQGFYTRGRNLGNNL